MVPEAAKDLQDITKKQALWEDSLRRFYEALADMSWDDIFKEPLMVSCELLLPGKIVDSMNALEKEIATLEDIKACAKRQVQAQAPRGLETRDPASLGPSIR